MIGVLSFGVGSCLGWAVHRGDTTVTTAGGTPTSTSTTAAGGKGSAKTSAPATSTTTTTAADPNGSGKPVTFVFGGDVHFEGSLRSTLQKDPAALFGGLQPALRDADVAVVNLETAIGSGGTKAPKTFNFQAPPAAFDALTAAGVDAISMANNHALDYGQDGLLQTLDAAKQVNAPIIGIGGNELAAFAPWTKTVNGQRIAVISATSVIDGNLVANWTATADHPGVASAKRLDSLLAAVRQARSAADTVVVFLHWGTEATFCPNGDQKGLAPKLVEAGADIVVGGHAHRVLSGGYLKGAYVDYGLGNLVFQAQGNDSRDTGLLRVTATGRTINSAEWLPGRIGGNNIPALLDGSARDKALATWNGRRDCTGLTAAPS